MKNRCRDCDAEIGHPGPLCDRCQAKRDRYEKYREKTKCPECGFKIEWQLGHWRCYVCGWSTEIEEGENEGKIANKDY